MVGAAETPYDLRFRLLGIPVRIHPLFWLVIGGAWLAGSQSAGGRAVGGLRFCFDPRPRVWARLDGEGVRLLAIDRPLGIGRPVLQPGRAPDAGTAVGGHPERARRGVRAFRGGARSSRPCFSRSRRRTSRRRSSRWSALAHFPDVGRRRFADGLHSESGGIFLDDLP